MTPHGRPEGSHREPQPGAGSPTAPRVLLLCQSLDQAGGVERFACGLANHLAGQGWATALGSLDTSAGAVAYPLLPAVRLLTARPTAAGLQPAPPTAAGPRPALPAAAGRNAGLLRRWHLARAQWRTGRALAGLVRAERPDVVVLNGLTTACSVLLFGPGCAARAICCDHNHFDARSRPWRWLRARLYPKVAAIVSLTETDAPKFRQLNPRTEVIANASALRREQPPGDLPANDSVPDDAISGDRSPGSPAPAPHPPPLSILAVGRCVAQKGFDLLLQAWQQVPRNSPVPARLRIVGEGPLRDALVAEGRRLGIDETIDWLAPTPGIERHYREAAVFVLPSRYEGLPLVLLEAQAMGLPTVAFDCPTGPAEVVTPETGILVPPEDVAALAEALTALLAEPALRRRMGRAAWERSRAHFSPQAHLEQWTALIGSVAQQGAKKGAEQGAGPARHA